MTNGKMFLAMLFGAVLRRWSRAVMAVVSSMVGAATLFCLAAVSIAVPRQMSESMRSFGANLVVSAVAQTDSRAGISDDEAASVDRLVAEKGKESRAGYRYETVRINNAPYLLAGIDPDGVKALNRHWTVEGDWPTPGKVLVGRDIATAIGAEPGSTVKIGYRASDNAGSSASSGSHTSTSILDGSGTQFQVAGIVDTGGSEDQIVYAVDSDVVMLSGEKRGYDVLEYSTAALGTDLDALTAEINGGAALSDGGDGAVQLKAQPVTKITSSDTRIIAMLKTLFWLVSVVILALTLVGVSTTMTSIVSQRRSEIGLRKALGASSRSIGTEFFVEAACYGLMGGLVGTFLGHVLAYALCVGVFNQRIGFDWPLGALSVLLAVVVAVIASAVPVRRASRIDPALVLREE